MSDKGEKKYLYAIMVMMAILFVSIPILSYITVRNSEIIFHVYDTSNDTKEIVEEVHLTANETQKQAQINQNQSEYNSKQISSLNESFIDFAQDRNKAFNMTLKNQNESFANQQRILEYQIQNELEIINIEKHILGNLTNLILDVSGFNETNESERAKAVDNIIAQNNKKIDMATEKICKALIKGKVIKTC